VARIPQQHRLAAKHGLTTLYKFRAYDTPQRRAWVRQILVESRIYMSRSDELNDELDLRPLVSVRRGATDAATRHRLLEAANAHWSTHQVPFTNEHIEGRRRTLATQSLAMIEAEAMARTHARLNSYWIFSLSSTRDYLPMWDDYADNKRGLCIHFRADAHSPFGFAQQVLYQENRPVLQAPFEELTEQDVADRATLTKTAKWAVEQEYRLIRYPDFDYSEFGLTFTGQFASFPRSAVCGITVGLEMSAADIAEIAQIAATYDPPLPICRPQRDSVRTSKLDVGT
jgi:hypothetical protein